MSQHIVFDAELIRRYDQSGPRYTSYPTVARFHGDITQQDYLEWVRQSNEDPIPRPLSIYIHIPFCDTVCFYCACNKVVTKDHSRATPYLARLYREIAMQAALFDPDRIVEQLHWGGGTPTFLGQDQMRELMEVTRRHFPLLDDDSGEYSIEIDPRSVTEEKLAVLRSIGFNRISLGVQDFNPVVQQAVNRIQDAAQTRDVVNTVRNLEFKSLNMDLMYGLPHQSVESFGNTLEQVVAIGPDRLAIYNYAHLPGRFKPQRRIQESDLPSANEKLDILQHTIEYLTAADYVYIGMDHFARPDDELAIAQRSGTLHRNFQGYSTNADCDLISLGVTAIGKVCDNYSQNVRDLEEYYRRIDAGRLALERGYELEPDDLLRREIIQELMCHFTLDIRALERKWQCSFATCFSDAIGELQHMEADGLLKLTEENIEVLPAGRLLVRNICMAFDRYREHDSSREKFSRVI
jgi:oxygen-independent coproporphyrinogen-3 oxidase